MTIVDDTPATRAAEREPPTPRVITAVSGTGDKVFRRGIAAAGIVVLIITGAVGLFLAVKSAQALQVAGFHFLTTQKWEPDTHKFGIAAAIPGTIIIALVALTVATPIALGTALFISEIATGFLKRAMIALVDLMVAIPSVIQGLFGFGYLQGHALGVARWISTWFGWIPLFKVNGADPHNPLSTPSVYTASSFIAGIVVAIIIIPIQASVMRDVFSQAPAGEREGAFALGATRWGMIRAVVLPFGRGGIIGGTMLALGRALGETVAVYLIISLVYHRSFHILEKGAISVSSLIATRYGDSSALGLSALFAAGLTLFAMTMLVNFTASIVISRSRSGAQSGD